MKMPTADDIRLACGEMTAQEMRTAKAVLTWFIAMRSSESLERDAERYRWLRDTRPWPTNLTFGILNIGNAVFWDAAIDAAMRSGGDNSESPKEPK